MKSFASDNNSPVHEAVMEAVLKANEGDYVSYGADPFTEKALKIMKKTFGSESESFFVFTGTAANVLGISAVTRSYHSIITATTSHMNVDECGAPEKFTGCKLFTLDAPLGKLSPDSIAEYLYGFGVEHHSQPGVISITQPTELGTVYTIPEIKALSVLAHDHGLLLHMDGARLANAAVALGCNLYETSGGAGVDVLSFGGTKNGMMSGESVIFFNGVNDGDFKYIRKQGMQLGSKMRYISAQFIPYLEDGIWKTNAAKANNAAEKLASMISGFNSVELIYPVETNGIFAAVPGDKIEPLQKESFFYVWDEVKNQIRWMCSYDTSESDLKDFYSLLKRHLC